MGHDSIIGTADMKKQGERSWVAIIVGFSKESWGSVFMFLFQKHGMPCSDYVLRRPTTDYLSFLEGPASYSNMSNRMRFLLVQFLAFSIEEACQFTPHSWRHFYPTASRQMLMSNDLGCEIGHWVQGSRMPEKYDAIASSGELAAKNTIV